MSAPHTALPSSISSSGHADGLGRRVLAFDRETGAMLERLHLRPELAAFESTIRERVLRLSTFEDERFARSLVVERDPECGDLTVVSEFIPGSLLSDLLETSHDETVVPGVDVALGYLLDALPALSTLHSVAGFSHGLIGPSRIVLTPAGQVVFLSPAFGEVVERLGLSAHRLWSEFGIAVAPSPTSTRFDAAADIAQVVLSAVMLVLGRPLREDEYPDAVPSLLMEVIDVAQIRGSTAFAGGLQRILQRTLPLPGRRPYLTVDELVVDVRQLVRREIGVDLCRTALAEFVAQMDGALGVTRDAVVDYPALPGEDDLGEHDPSEDDLSEDELTEEAEEALASEALTEGDDTLTLHEDTDVQIDADAGSGEIEISLDEESGSESAFELPLQSNDAEAPGARVGELTESAHPEIESAATSAYHDETPVEALPDTTESVTDHAPELSEPVETAFQADARSEPSETVPSYEDGLKAEEELKADDETRVEAASGEDESREDESREDESQEDESKEESWAASEHAESEAETATEPAAQPDHDSKSSRRKRQQQRSARARKDKLRSTTAPPEAAPAKPTPPPSQPQPTPSRSGWLVPPDRAAAFDAPVPEPVPAQPIFTPSAVSPHSAPPPQPPFAPVQAPFVPPPIPQPVFPPLPPHHGVASPHTIVPAPSTYGVPVAARSTPVAAPQPVSRLDGPAPTLKLKTAPAPRKPPRRTPSIVDRPGVEPLDVLPHTHRGSDTEGRSFPWKLAGVGIALIAALVIGGRVYLASSHKTDEAVDAPAAPAVTPSVKAPETPRPPAKGMGQVVIQTQPDGAKVLLDGKAAGETPLTLDAPPGKHVITLIAASGTVRKTVRVAAGKSQTLDVPIFSGWVAVFAPILLDVSEDGKSMGTTEQSRMMLSAGHHKLTLSNPDLGYSAVQEVEIEPGEVRSLTVTPRGPASFNAVPWAEVWMDGKKLGETPLANQDVPLGVHEFVFKNPQYPDRKVTQTIRAGDPAAVSVDFTKPQSPL